MVVCVVDEGDAKSGLVAFGPFKVAARGRRSVSQLVRYVSTKENLLHQAPRHVSADIHTVQRVSVRHGSDIVAEILHAELVIQDLVHGQVILALETGAILGNVDLGLVVAVAEPFQQLPEPNGVGSQPGRLCLGTDPFAVLVLQEYLQVAGDVIRVRLACLGFDVVGAVVVHTVEVVAAVDEGDIFGGPGGQAVTQLFDHAVWVLAVIDGVSEPGNSELDLAIAGLNICGVFGIPRLSPVTWNLISNYFMKLCTWRPELVPFNVMPISPPSLGLNSSL